MREPRSRHKIFYRFGLKLDALKNRRNPRDLMMSSDDFTCKAYCQIISSFKGLSGSCGRSLRRLSVRVQFSKSCFQRFYSRLFALFQKFLPTFDMRGPVIFAPLDFSPDVNRTAAAFAVTSELGFESHCLLPVGLRTFID